MHLEKPHKQIVFTRYCCMITACSFQKVFSCVAFIPTKIKAQKSSYSGSKVATPSGPSRCFLIISSAVQAFLGMNISGAYIK